MEASSHSRLRISNKRPTAKVLLASMILLILGFYYVDGFSNVSTAASSATLPSWNPSVACSATLTTISELIGGKVSSLGGASHDGGGFKPGIPDMRSTSPPCTYGQPPNATFVEIHNVQLASAKTSDGDCAAYPNGNFCSTTFNILDPTKSTDNIYLNRLYVSIERAWKASGIAPPKPQNNTVMIDIQGFVFWYGLWANQSWHSYSGWEIHPLTAWRFSQIPGPAAPAGGSFTFAAAGDLAANLNTAAGLNRLALSKTSFFLALGDLSYSAITPETAWCAYVSSMKSPAYPFELISGNHEDSGHDGLIDNFAACLPDKVGGMTGTYAKEYYFDYPSNSPLARFVLISPNLNFTNGGEYQYKAGTTHYSWLSNVIDDARAGGIPWVVVGMHETCVSAGTTNCEVGMDLVNLLFQKKVDLVLMGHDHNYQRSKQLTCEQEGSFVSSCVANNGSTGVYQKGAGTVFIIGGTGGSAAHLVNSTDPEAPYFASLMGANSAGFGYGFVQYTITHNSIIAKTSFAGTFSDTFAITSSFTLSANPSSLTIVRGTAGTTTVTVSTLNGYQGKVTLTATTSPSGPTLLLVPSSVTLSSDNYASVVLTVVTDPTTPAGTFTIMVTGTDGTLYSTTAVTVTVVAPVGI